MKNPSRFLCLAAAILVLAAGCDTPPARNPRSTQTVELSPGQPAATVETGVVTAVRIVLPGPDVGSGYVWEIASNNNTILEQLGPLAVAAGGAGPTTTVSFYALKPGKSILQFVLVRPGESEATPAGMCQVIVRVVD